MRGGGWAECGDEGRLKLRIMGRGWWDSDGVRMGIEWWSGVER